MTYADSLLASGESVLLRTSQHFFVLLRAFAAFVLTTIVAAIFLYLTINNPDSTLGQITLGLGLLVLVIGIARMTLSWFTWRCEEYLVTNHRVMKVEGVINKRSADSSLEKINDAILTQGLLGRIFGFGSLDIMTAAESTVDQFRMLRDPIGFKKAMLEAKNSQYAAGVTG